MAAYTVPPFIAFGTVALNAGSANIALVAPLGANIAIRVVALFGGINRFSGANIVDAQCFDNSGANGFGFIDGLSLTGQPNWSLPIPSPGILMPVNVGVTVQYNGSIVAGAGVATMYYYLDLIT